MNDTVPLILKVESLHVVRFSSLLSRRAHVAVVCADVDGELFNLEDMELKWTDHAFPKFRTRHEVDMSDHLRPIKLRLPAQGDVHFFEATVDVGFRVTDPVKVVRRNIEDAMPVVSGYLVGTARGVTRWFDISRGAEAERVVNARLAYEKELDEGIAIYWSWMSLTPDAEFRGHLDAMEKAQRTGLLKDEEHKVAVADAQRRNQLDEITESAKIDAHVRAIRAVGSRKLSLSQLIDFHLQRNPDDGDKAIGVMAQFERDRALRRDTRDDKWIQLFQFLVANGLVKPNDIDSFREEAMGRLWMRPASAGHPDRTNVVLPAYVVVDESKATADYLTELNSCVRSLHTVLLGEPDAASVVRLCVLGFAADVAERLAPGAVARGRQAQALSTRNGLNYGAVFQALFDRLPNDVLRLWAEGSAVHRPVVFFLTGGPPMDGSTWGIAHGQLVDRRTRWYAPHIVAYGIGTAEESDVRRIATQADFAFMSQIADPALAIRTAFRALQRSVVKSGHAFANNRITMVVSRPKNFRVASGAIQSVRADHKAPDVKPA